MTERIIIGKDIILNPSRDDTEMNQLLSKYWREGTIHTDITGTYDNYTTMQENSVYYGDGLNYCKFPIPFAKMKVEMTILRYRRKKMHLRYIDKKREASIGFRSQHSTFYRAFFLLKAKTLIFGHYEDIDFVTAVLDWLKTGNYISLLVDDGIPALDMMNIVEIHNGMPEIVEAPIRTKVVTVGCDPEFEVLRNSRVISPPQRYKGTSGRIGLDGAGSQIELRPNAGTPEEVITDLTTLFRQLDDPITTLGNTFPLGGHVHVGVGRRATPTFELLWLLDYFLGIPTKGLCGNARGSYLRLSAYEQKPWGFEYRTPPAAIFVNPSFARLSMKICQEVTACYIHGQKIRVNTPNPLKEDYLNYCNFTDEEYEEWVRQIKDYNLFMHSPSVLSRNISSLWDDSIPSHTKLVSTCSNASWKTNKCGAEECVKCYPTTAPAVIAARRTAEEARNAEIRASRDSERIERNRIANIQNGLVEGRNRLSHFNVSANDDWNVEALNAVANKLEQLGYQSSHSVTLFGLAERRGMVVSGFNIDGFSTCLDIHAHSSHIYGIPYCCRINDAFRDTLCRMIEQIYSVEREIVVRECIDRDAFDVQDNGTAIPSPVYTMVNGIATTTTDDPFDAALARLEESEVDEMELQQFEREA